MRSDPLGKTWAMNVLDLRSCTIWLALGAMLASASASAEDTFTPLTAVPFNPTTTPVPGTDGKWHFVYELVLANARKGPATLESVRVDELPATFEAATFPTRLRQLDNQPAADAEIVVNSTRLFLIDLATTVPDLPTQLHHQLRLTAQGTDPTNATPVEQQYPAATIDVTRRLPVLHPPLAGSGWVAFNGCCAPMSAHRGTVLPVNGRLHFAQRFAIDWMRLDDLGRIRNGPVDDVRSYTSYGEQILAVADGVVVDTQDGLPNQVPPNLPDRRTTTLANVDGNHVVLDIGNGIFAFFAHMQPGSVRVKNGQKVRTGDVLGLVGNTGNSSAPHLHFHIMDTASVLGSEGLPYVIDRFQFAGSIPEAAIPDDLGGDYRSYRAATPQPRTEQFPLNLDVIDFLP